MKVKHATLITAAIGVERAKAKQRTIWSACVQLQFNDFISEFNSNKPAVAQGIPLSQPSLISSPNSTSSL